MEKLKIKSALIYTVGTIIILSMIVWGVTHITVTPKEPIPLQVVLAIDSVKTAEKEARLKSNDSIRGELNAIINDLQDNQKQLRVKSSKQEKVISELYNKLNKDNSLETCKALVKAQDIQLENKQTQIDSLDRELYYFAVLNDSTEDALLLAKSIIKQKEETIKDISNLYMDKDKKLSEANIKNQELENRLHKKKGNFLKGFVAGTVIGYAAPKIYNLAKP